MSARPPRSCYQILRFQPYSAAAVFRVSFEAGSRCPAYGEITEQSHSGGGLAGLSERTCGCSRGAAVCNNEPMCAIWKPRTSQACLR